MAGASVEVKTQSATTPYAVIIRSDRFDNNSISTPPHCNEELHLGREHQKQ